MTIREALISLCSYPVPEDALLNIEERRGVRGNDLLLFEDRFKKEFRLAESDVYEYVGNAPDISEGGITISLSDSQRKTYLSICNSIRVELQEKKSIFGYKGSRL